MDYYGVLNVNQNATQEDIKKAYRRLSRKYHPDNVGEQAREQFDRVQEAYAVLGDEERRSAYDRQTQDNGNSGQSGKKDARADGGQRSNKQDNYYEDLAAFYTVEYKNSFDKFFGAGIKKQSGQNVAAKPVNTDKLFESFFKCR